MAKLYFDYSAMNAGKSTVLLQSSHNYKERGMNTLLLTPEIGGNKRYVAMCRKHFREAMALAASPP